MKKLKGFLICVLGCLMAMSVAFAAACADDTVSVESVTLSQDELTLEIGETETLTATVLPDNATNKTVTWESSTPSVATVEDGTVTAVAAGTATITATAGGQSDTCTVTVNEPAVPATGITLSRSTFSGAIGETVTLTAELTPSDATGTVSFRSSNTAIATVNSSGVVTITGVGEAVITASVSGSTVTATCAVTGTDYAADDGATRYLTGISVNFQDAKRNYLVGEEFTTDGLAVTASVSTVDSETGATTSTSYDITSVAQYDTSEFDNTTPGTYTIYVYYVFRGSERSTTYTVNVVSDVMDQIHGLDVQYGSDQQAVLTATETSASIDLSTVEVREVTGTDADNATFGEVLARGEYSLYYSKDGGAPVEIAEDATSITGLTRGTYSIYAEKDVTVGGETYTMDGFFLFYVIDPVVSIEWNEDGTVRFAEGYEADEEHPAVGSDWTYTVTLTSGAKFQASYSDVAISGINTDNSTSDPVSKTATASYTDTYPYINEQGVLADYSQTLEAAVSYTIEGNTQTGEVTETIALEMSDVYAALGVSTVANGTELVTGTVSSSGITVVRDEGMGLNTSSANSSIGSHSYRLQFGGGVSGSALAIEISGNETTTATITAVFRSSSGGAARQIGLFTSMDALAVAPGTTLKDINVNLNNSTDVVTFTVTGAGTYYLGSVSSGVNMYYISVETTTVVGGGATNEDVAVNIGDIDAATLTQETSLSADGSIAVTASADADSSVVIEENSKTLNGNTYTKRMKLGGTGSLTARSIKLAVKDAATITIYGMSSSSSATRAVALYDESFTAINTDYSAVAGDKLYEITYEVSAGGTYYFASTSGGFNVYYIAITY